jgi:hypothetical protein
MQEKNGDSGCKVEETNELEEGSAVKYSQQSTYSQSNSNKGLSRLQPSLQAVRVNLLSKVYQVARLLESLLEDSIFNGMNELGFSPLDNRIFWLGPRRASIVYLKQGTVSTVATSGRDACAFRRTQVR